MEPKQSKISTELKQTSKGEWYIGSIAINADSLEEISSLMDSSTKLMLEKINFLNNRENINGEKETKEKEKEEKEEIILTPDEEKLFIKLKTLRFELAQKEGYPPFIIFHDSILKQLAKSKPVTEESIIKIIGEKKFEKYGKSFLREIFQAI